MEIILNPSRNEWSALCRRNIPSDDTAVDTAVRQIIEAVAQNGDEALREYTKKFDGVDLADITMSQAEIDEAAAKVTKPVADAIHAAAKNIETFHAAQLMAPIEINTTEGVTCLQKQVPIQRVGLYIPGGRAPLFSTVLMLGIPARVAGCKEVMLCTPRNRDFGIAPEIAYAAKECGISTIYQIGGAQAIAAMAYGTETVKRADKIFGPGNRYVTKAKQLVNSQVAIDMPAGPSEVMVLADNSADPDYIASDLLSQAEHGPDSQAMLVTDDLTLAKEVLAAIERQKEELSRKESVEASLSGSRAIVIKDKTEIIEFANAYAPEHLIINMKDPWEIAEKITAAGSVFIGPYSCESAGDYASGTNHTLPTSAWAHAYSGVNTDSFMKKITYQHLSKEGLDNLAPIIITMAKAEGLDAHAKAVEIRCRK